MLSAALVAIVLHAGPTPEVADTLIGAALEHRGAYPLLTDLVDRVGPRLSGSAGAEAAVVWGVEQFQAMGVSVHREPVQVPVWVRGVETGEILADAGHRVHPLALTALGGSPSTAKGGLTAEVVEVSSLAELEAQASSVRGRVVFFNHAMSVAKDYRRFGELRGKGPAEAGALGAVGALVRSLATASMRSPHTGGTRTDGVRIPSAAISVEDAELLHRLLVAGPVKVHLVLGSRNLPDAMSSNVVAEIRGGELPDEVVLLGAHLDSWDLAVGAQDDGAGVAMVLETARLIAGLPRPPRRTVRFVLFMNEENGLRGGKAYAAAHAAELPQLAAAMELDAGSGPPLGVAVKAGAGGKELVRRWLPPLGRVGAAVLSADEAGGSDLMPLETARVPVVTVVQDMTHYFDIHHSAADTLDRVDPEALAKATAAAVWITYALADSAERLPRPDAPPPAAGAPAPLKAPAPGKSSR